MATLTQDLRRLRTLTRREERASKQHKELKRERERFEQQCMNRMEREECSSHKLSDGTLFVHVPEHSSVYGSVQDRAAFVEWARENEPELIEDKERRALLTQLVRQRFDDGEELPPGIGVYFRPYISQRAG